MARNQTSGRTRVIVLASLVSAGTWLISARAADPPQPQLTGLANDYAQQVRPLLERYCHRCHSPKRTEADIDLAAFASLTDVRKEPETWQKVSEMLDSGQMPPQSAPMPTPDERRRIGDWVRGYLKFEARALAGDPGPVVLRRLSNAQYTYTVRDLTGVESLDPAREFPADGAAGEGFTNTGNALVMSPSLLAKYLDAAKEIAGHAVLLRDGLRFSPSTTRRDRTEEVLARIRHFYQQYSDSGGGARVNLQGIVFDTNQGGRLPLDKYLLATLAERESLSAGRTTIDRVARERSLSPKYLRLLWTTLQGNEPSLIIDGLRKRWREATPAEAATLADEIARWQQSLWKFASVGHIGKVGGPKAWMEPVDPLTTRQEVRLKIPAPADGKDVTLYLVASDAGDGHEHDFVVWEQPRLVAAGRPSLLLRDVREVTRELTGRRERLFAATASCLAAAAEANSAAGKFDLAALARKHGVDADALAAWLDYLGIGTAGSVAIEGYFTRQITSAAGYDFIRGWGSHDTPLLVANSTDQHVRIPGNMRPHSVAVHPSPTRRAAVGWRSPTAATLRVTGQVTHAHPECGNGVTWSIELRRGGTRQRLATGIAQGAKSSPIGPIDSLAVQSGDLVSLLIGPRDGNHACDLTAIELTLTNAGAARVWDLARDISPDVLAGNPHADQFGNAAVWHFYTEPDKGGESGAVIPAGSLLAKWQSAADASERRKLAGEVQRLLTAGPPAGKDSPDAALYRQLASLGGPLFGRRQVAPVPPADTARPPADSAARAWGLDPSRFGRHPRAGADAPLSPGETVPASPAAATIDPASLCLQAPSLVEVRLPADLVEGCEFVTAVSLHRPSGSEGSVQVQVLTTKPEPNFGLWPSTTSQTNVNGPWTSDNRRVSHSTPIIVGEGSAARRRIEAAFAAFRAIFPAALCYTKIVPVDEVVTLTLFYREDDPLRRLMLDDAQAAELDRLWDELHYVSHDAITLVDAFEQLWQYATQDADPKVFEPLRKPIQDRAAAFRRLLIDTEPRHLDAVLDVAARAYRRPLHHAETRELRGLYASLRQQDLPHEEAIRLTLARVFVAPAFLYRIERPAPGAQPTAVSDWELASRLSYFLWSSLPDAELQAAAATGRLHETPDLLTQLQRMRRDPRVRRMAEEFACQWLHIYDFDQLDEKSERHFPTFLKLRDAMYEESIRFFTDLFQRDGSILEIVAADHTFLNEDLARHYGIPGVSGPDWRRVDGIGRFARGGILAQATTLAKQSGASRTSPILRGNWISEVLLGEKLPRPPKDVPRLPEDETATQGLTVRQLVEKHSSDPACAKCHARIDPYGFALEGFDAIGRRRAKDLADRPIDTRVTALDGAQFEGIDGLRRYLLTVRRAVFVRQFCRKLLGYALGRAVQLSDEPLLDEIETELKAKDYRIAAALETIVRSRQFREIRGRDAAPVD